MALVNFYRGLKEKYNQETHSDGLFFSTDTQEIILNGKSYGGEGIADVDFAEGKLTFTFLNSSTLVVPITEATSTDSGLMSASDKASLDIILGEGAGSITDLLTQIQKAQSDVDNIGNVIIPEMNENTAKALDGKVDKVPGKSLVDDTEIDKLSNLPNKSDLDSAIADAKKAGTDAQTNLTAHIGNKENPHEVTKVQVGLGNLTNDAQVKRSEMGTASGVATLDENGLVPSSQLPSFVDDVLEFDLKDNFPTTGETGKIYVAKDSNLTYRWSGTQYVEISASLALGETSSTAYAGDKGKALADKIAEAYGASSVINGLSDITIDSDDTEGQFLSAPNAVVTWNGSKEQNDIKIPYATSQKAGVMSKDDKAKLDQLTAGIEEGTPSIKDISDRVEAIETAVGDSGTLETESKEVVGAINELKGLVDQNTTNHTELEARVQANEQNIATIQGEEGVDGSIKKALKDAKDYADSKLTWTVIE